MSHRKLARKRMNLTTKYRALNISMLPPSLTISDLSQIAAAFGIVLDMVFYKI